MRAALLVNVVLPEMVKQSSALVEKLAEEASRLINARTKAFGMFSLDAIDSLHVEIGRVEEQVRNSSLPQRRIKESVDGYESLLTFLSRPFDSPLADPTGSLKPAKGEKGWECIEEFFSFGRDNRLLLNDRRKANSYTRQIHVNLRRLENSLSSLQHELSDSLSLLEERRSLLWSQRSTWLAILYPAAGAVILGGLWLLYLYFARRSAEEKHNVLAVLIPAVGACVGSVLWWLFEL